MYFVRCYRLSPQHLRPGSGWLQLAEGGQSAHPVRDGRHSQVRQLYVREDRLDGEHRDQVRPLPLPLRHRVQPDCRSNSLCHVAQDWEKSKVRF